MLVDRNTTRHHSHFDIVNVARKEKDSTDLALLVVNLAVGRRLREREFCFSIDASRGTEH